ncbi:hypothetical protein ACFQHV_22150 [Promicromonospora thailandica]|uniref:Uncharacterized protein n=1 Tax=Promicromonospora thailandica TaxID=765201 RepID=A0A9X2JWF9_9MICO|nr:hypothetical protein [Promicromonospora thailandica]MCP2263089.1 hypothetical protein [Promicromonospora thailandica]BFF18467.1 hypothetical protein GCM10025730_19880 [Promicromonospora thailandica]
MSASLDRDDVVGREWDFLATDRDGSVALISSAGYGPIPEAVLSHGVAVETVVEGLRTQLPVIGESLDCRQQDRSGDYSDWFGASRRGLYTYDWHVYDGFYKQVSAPSAVLRAEGLTPEISRVAALLRLPVLFAETAQLSLDERGIESFKKGVPA